EQELKNLLLLSKSRDLVFFMGKSEDFIQAKNLAKNVVSDMLAKKDMAPVNVANAILEKLSEHMETVNARGETRKKVEAIYQIAFKTVESGSDNKEALKNISKLSDELNSNLSKWQAPPEILNAAENISKIVKNTNPSMQAIIENSKIILGVMEQKKKNQTALANLIDGLKAFSEPDNAHQRSVVLYFLLVILLFTTFTTMNSVPYYALGIELCPSYDGRTKVVVWRSIMDNIAGIVGPWIPVFCFSLFFENALQGLWWVALFTACIGIPSTIIMVMFTKERGHISAQKRKGAMEMGLFKSIWITLDNIHFIKIVLLYSSIGLVIGLFTQIGFYLNVYWVMKSAVGGAKLGAWVGMVAWGLGLITLPVINWGCKRFQKHTMMAIAMSIMSVGCILKWWCMNPKYPYLQLILPFFFSIGIASTYTVLATMMSDVTDVDELRTGQRREGMFGAVNAFILKLVGTITPALAGAILVLSGFDPDLGFEQKASTILNMRILYSFVPGILTLFCLLLLYRYPLTREKVMEIKKQLKERREAAASVAPATTE
ncbi:MAG: MFS transporter, partial [Candidatus Nanoarchaeia archaeon]